MKTGALPPRWERHVVSLSKGGHRLFRDVATRQYALADDSGLFPEDTDHGIMWLDRKRPVTLDLEPLGSVLCRVPVLRESGAKAWTVGPVSDVMVLLREIPSLTVEVAADVRRLAHILGAAIQHAATK